MRILCDADLVRGRGAGAIGFLVVVIAGCGSSGGSRSTQSSDPVVTANGTPAVRAGLQPAGSPLADGYDVPAGASLVGAALPDSLDNGPDLPASTRRWTATLFVEGSLVSVTNALTAQAARQGLTTDRGFWTPEGLGCRERTAGGMFDPDPDLPAEPDGVKCHVVLTTGDRTRTLTIRGEQGTCDRCTQTLAPSLAVVTYDEGTRPPSTYEGPPVSAQPPVTIRPPTSTLPLPTPGDELRLGPSTEIRVEPGSQPLTPAAPGIAMTLAPGGESVLDRYVNHTSHGVIDKGERTEQRDGWTVHAYDADDADLYVSFELFTRPNSPSYLRITANGLT